MTLILLWFATSAAVGWLGRKRVIGFWGFFVLSLIISPIVTGIFLLIAAPGREYKEETEKRVAASFRRAGFAETQAPRLRAAEQVTASITTHIRTPGLRLLVGVWLAVVAVFAVVYWAAAPAGGAPPAGNGLSLMGAVGFSFDVGTLGSGGSLVAGNTGLAWLASLERLLVLVILVMLVSSLISAQLAGLRAKEQATNNGAGTSPGQAAPASISSISLAQVAEDAPPERSPAQ